MAKSEVDSFLEEVGNSEVKADPFESEADPLVPREKVEKGDLGKGSEDGEKVPFHKDPKVQRFIEKEISKRLKDVKPAPAAPTGDTVDQGEEILTRIIGNDTPEKVRAIKDFKTYLSGLEEKGAQKALSQLQEQADAEKAEEAKAQEELVTAFDAIEEEFGVDLTSNSPTARKERNDFVDFIKRISPKDADGNIIQYPDLQETWSIFKSSKAPDTKRRAKDIATRSMDRSTDSGSAPTGGKTWKDVDRIFSRLSS